jgi:hypothetical protein
MQIYCLIVLEVVSLKNHLTGQPRCSRAVSLTGPRESLFIAPWSVMNSWFSIPWLIASSLRTLLPFPLSLLFLPPSYKELCDHILGSSRMIQVTRSTSVSFIWSYLQSPFCCIHKFWALGQKLGKSLFNQQLLVRAQPQKSTFYWTISPFLWNPTQQRTF